MVATGLLQSFTVAAPGSAFARWDADLSTSLQPFKDGAGNEATLQVGTRSVKIVHTFAAGVALTVKGAASQTGDYLVLEDNAGAVVVGLSPYDDGVDEWFEITTGKGLVAEEVMVGGQAGLKFAVVGGDMQVQDTAGSLQDLDVLNLSAAGALIAPSVKALSNVNPLTLNSINYTIAKSAVVVDTGEHSHSSGTGYGLFIRPTMNTTGTGAGVGMVCDLRGTLAGSGADLIADFRLATVSKLQIDTEGLLNFLGTMGNSSKDPTITAPDDWVQVDIDGVTHYLGAYLA